MVPMTAGRLIEILKAFPPETQVHSQCDTGGGGAADVYADVDPKMGHYSGGDYPFFGGEKVESPEDVVKQLARRTDKPVFCWILG